MAKPRATANRANTSRPKQSSLIWLQGLLCGALVTLATPTALLLGVLLAPALLAIVFDRQPGRPRARSIGLCSMAAAVDPLRSLWIGGHGMATAMGLVSNLQTVATAWCAAAVGWLLAECAPVAVRGALEAVSLARTARLRAERARLVDAWGLETTPDDH